MAMSDQLATFENCTSLPSST
jgi:hypothetical protein